MDCRNTIKKIRRTFRQYLANNNLECVVLGVSGGIDSALVAALADPVCRKHNVKLIGRSLPIATNKPEEIERARAVGEYFCHEFEEVNLKNVFNYKKELYSWIEGDLSKLDQANLKARTRMEYLYLLAGKYKGMVLSTDNLTEYYTGFWTLHGDVGDYAMIQYLWKTEVYDLARCLVREFDRNGEGLKSLTLDACIDAVPTDGLGVSTSDFDQLGVKSYEEADKLLKTWLTESEDDYLYCNSLNYPGRLNSIVEFFRYRNTIEYHPIIRRYEQTKFKRLVPISISRQELGLL